MLRRARLGRSDLAVSALCYGTNMLGTALDQDAADGILDSFVEAGGNFVDTARSYGDWVKDAPTGASERAIGSWLARRKPADMIVATKGGFFDMRAAERINRCTPHGIATDIAQSLDHLGAPAIDLYWLHTDNIDVPVAELVDSLVEHQRAGRIRSFGLSNWSPARIREAVAHAVSIDHPGPVAFQPFWGLARPNDAAADAQGYRGHYESAGYRDVHGSGLPAVPYAGQSRGYFDKAARRDAVALPDTLSAMYDNPTNHMRLAALQRLAERHGRPVNALALAYLMNQPCQTVPIIGARSAEQLRTSIAAADIVLSSDELAELAVVADDQPGAPS